MIFHPNVKVHHRRHDSGPGQDFLEAVPELALAGPDATNTGL